MRTWVTSDHHFGHQGMCDFIDAAGSKVRPWKYAQQADEEMVVRWNSAVAPEDKVYHLGDFAFSNRHLQIAGCLRGNKVLIRGNHDRLKLSQYAHYFKDVRGCHAVGGVLLTHLPVHHGSMGKFIGNAHGHTHGNPVLTAGGIPDPRYFNACVESCDYRPVLLDDIIKKLRSQNA